MSELLEDDELLMQYSYVMVAANTRLHLPHLQAAHKRTFRWYLPASMQKGVLKPWGYVTDSQMDRQRQDPSHHLLYH